MARKFKVIKEFEIMGVVHKKGTVFQVTGQDRVTKDTFSLCFGHGAMWDLKIGVDVVPTKNGKEDCVR